MPVSGRVFCRWGAAARFGVSAFFQLPKKSSSRGKSPPVYWSPLCVNLKAQMAEALLPIPVLLGLAVVVSVHVALSWDVK
jgi:hypothetical protein